MLIFHQTLHNVEKMQISKTKSLAKGTFYRELRLINKDGPDFELVIFSNVPLELEEVDSWLES